MPQFFFLQITHGRTASGTFLQLRRFSQGKILMCVVSTRFRFSQILCVNKKKIRRNFTFKLLSGYRRLNSSHSWVVKAEDSSNETRWRYLFYSTLYSAHSSYVLFGPQLASEERITPFTLTGTHRYTLWHIHTDAWLTHFAVRSSPHSC